MAHLDEQVGVGGLLLVYGLVKIAGLFSGGKKADAHHAAEKKAVEFPQPKRDWEAEKREFVEAYVRAYQQQHHH